MAEDLLWQWNTCCQEDRWPDHCVEAGDVLTDNMDIGRPEFLIEAVIVTAPTERSDIVGKGIEPDIDNMTVVDRDRNAPVKGGAGDAKIFESPFDEIDHFVTATFRHDEIRMVFDILQEFVLIVAHLEEVAFFREDLGLFAAVRAVIAVNELQVGEKCFAAGAVMTAVRRFVDIAFFIDDLEEFLNGFDMVIVGRADELVIVDHESIPEVLEAARAFNDLIHVLFWRHAGSFSGSLDLHAMFVTAGEEKGVNAAHLFVTGCCVGEYCAVCIANVQLGTRVIDRCGDIEGIVAHCLASSG